MSVVAPPASEPADWSVSTVDWLRSRSTWLPFTVNTEPGGLAELDTMDDEGPGVSMNDDLGWIEDDPELEEGLGVSMDDLGWRKEDPEVDEGPGVSMDDLGWREEDPELVR